jgi:ABC-type Na+ efflux pump permease subunit
MSVSLLVLATYIGLGLMVLVSAAMVGLLDPWLLVYLLLFFLITYAVFASIMMAIGAAVNEMREAQSLLTPVMLVLMLPWMFAFPISRDPNTPFAIALSFIPPVNTFVMMIRLTSSTPPPGWQVALTAIIGVSTAVAALWFAAKVFKIGLLMHGKPPSLGTLFRWAKAA